MDFLTLFDLSAPQWSLFFLCALLVGMAKVGLPGVGTVIVPVLAIVFGGKPSTGILLPILIMADLFAVGYYHHHAQWKHLFKILPWAIAGILIAMYVGKNVSDEQFKILLGSVILLGIGIMIWREKGMKGKTIPDNWWFAGFMGLAGGFATMIGNAAGPIFAIYLLAMHMPKNKFIGTTAWFFCIINILKVPLHIWSWETINLQTFQLDLMVLPAVALGAFSGVKLVKLIPETTYRWFVIGITVLSAGLLIL